MMAAIAPVTAATRITCGVAMSSRSATTAATAPAMAPSTRSRTKRPTGVPSQATSSLTFLRLDSDLRQVGERRAYLLGRVLEVLELPIHIALVRTEIEVAVAGAGEGDGR